MQSEQPQGQVCIKCVTAVSVGDDNVNVSSFLFHGPHLLNLPTSQRGNRGILKCLLSKTILGGVCSFTLCPGCVHSNHWPHLTVSVSD